MSDPKPDTYTYAVNLLMSLRDKHIPEANQLEPLEDILGVLTQIDNLTTALTRAAPIDMPDQIEIYRLIKRAKVRTHGDIAKVIADHLAKYGEPKT